MTTRVCELCGDSIQHKNGRPLCRTCKASRDTEAKKRLKAFEALAPLREYGRHRELMGQYLALAVAAKRANKPNVSKLWAAYYRARSEATKVEQRIELELAATDSEWIVKKENDNA